MIVLPKESIDSSRKFLIEQEQERNVITNISFVVSTLSNSQLGLALVKGINSQLDKSAFIEFSIFSLLREMPIIYPKCGIYTIYNCLKSRNPLIATDYQSLMMVNNSITPLKYFYLYDTAILSKASPEIINNIRNSKVCIFTRTREHASFLTKTYGIKCHNIYVPNFEIEGILEIIYATTKEK